MKKIFLPLSFVVLMFSCSKENNEKIEGNAKYQENLAQKEYTKEVEVFDESGSQFIKYRVSSSDSTLLISTVQALENSVLDLNHSVERDLDREKGQVTKESAPSMGYNQMLSKMENSITVEEINKNIDPSYVGYRIHPGSGKKSAAAVVRGYGTTVLNIIFDGCNIYEKNVWAYANYSYFYYSFNYPYNWVLSENATLQPLQDKVFHNYQGGYTYCRLSVLPSYIDGSFTYNIIIDYEVNVTSCW